jgi:hypothetical protein
MMIAHLLARGDCAGTAAILGVIGFTVPNIRAMASAGRKLA